MATEQVAIQTRDGTCLTCLLKPIGGGPWPAVIFYMDTGGIRPALPDMAGLLAEAGFLVLLPDLFYRYGLYGPFVPKDVLAGDFRAILGPLMATTGNDKAAETPIVLRTAHSRSLFDSCGRSERCLKIHKPSRFRRP